MYGLSFDKINAITACCEDIYGRYCTQKSKNDHFHPQFAIIVFIIKDCSFSVVKNKQTRPQYLVLEKFITLCPLTNHVTITFIPSVLSACKDGGHRE